MLLIYLTDASSWSGGKAVPKAVLFGLTGLAIFVGVLFMFNAKPWLPLAFALLFQPIYHGMIQDTLFGDVHVKNYMKSMKTVTAVTAVLTCIVFVAFSHHNDFWWGTQSRLDFIDRLTNTSKTEAGMCDLAANLTDPDAPLPCPCTCEDCPALCDVGRDRGTASLYVTVVAQDSPCYCLAAFMLWGSGGMFATGMVVYAGLYAILASSTAGGLGTQLFMAFVVIGWTTAWMMGTILGTSMGAASVATGLGGVFALQAFLLVDKTIGRAAMKESIMSVAILKAAFGALDSKLADWFRAMFMIVVFPSVFLPLLFLSAINQFFRKAGIGQELEMEDGQLFFTKKFSTLISDMQNEWDWTSVLNKICVLGTVFFVASIAVAKLAVVFLSWMNESLETTSLVLVCVAYIFVGEFMFCNPLIPATPVYLTGGVVVVRSAERLLSGCVAGSGMLSQVRDGAWATYNAAKYAPNGEGVGLLEQLEGQPDFHTCWPTGTAPAGMETLEQAGCHNITADTCMLPGMRAGEVGVPREATNMLCFCNEANGGMDLHDNFWSAIVFASVVTFILKMCAIFLEMVVIGMTLGKKLVVRKFVGINSAEMRAIRMLVSVPGFNWKKCCILLGGPDWPTSVLTGILRLSVPQCLLGSSPFIILNTPTVIGGALQLRRAEGDMWSTLANVGFAMSAATQGTATSLCMYYVFDCSDKNREELEAMPDDEEVKAAEEVSERDAVMYKAATDWKTKVPGNIKIVLIIGAILNGTFVFLGALLGSKCWVSVDVADPISGPPLYGDWFAWIQPTGYIALGIYFVGVFFMRGFQSWGQAQVKKQMALDGGPGRVGEVEMGVATSSGSGAAAGDSYAPPVMEDDSQLVVTRTSEV